MTGSELSACMIKRLLLSGCLYVHLEIKILIRHVQELVIFHPSFFGLNTMDPAEFLKELQSYSSCSVCTDPTL